MVANANKLKGKIAENGLNIKTFADKISMCEVTFRRKMMHEGSFTIEESLEVKETLGLNYSDYMEIFYGDRLESKSREQNNFEL
jgi:hypothetical protein